jgi:hypothetical protein
MQIVLEGTVILFLSPLRELATQPKPVSVGYSCYSVCSIIGITKERYDNLAVLGSSEIRGLLE